MKTIPLNIRIENAVKKTDSNCWLLPAHKGCNGYAKLKVQGVHKRAHRVAYEAFVGPIPDKMLVLHHCDIRHCVNPEHLWIGTAKQNTEDMIKKGRARFVGRPKKVIQ
jgi:hypothetical protein